MNVKFKFFKMGQVLVDRYGNGQENKFNFSLLLLKLSSQKEFPGHVILYIPVIFPGHVRTPRALYL